MLRLIAILFGIAFIFAGVAGFLPIFFKDGLLFGYFQVNLMHNIVHLVSGILAIMSATSFKWTKLYFQWLGIIYALVAIVGFARRGDLGFIMMHMNMADNFLHTLIAIISLYLGFFLSKKTSPHEIE